MAKKNEPEFENPNKKNIVHTFQPPLLSLVPIPPLLVENVNIDFQMEVTTRKESLTSEGTKSWNINADVAAKVTNLENTRNTNQTAKYKVHVRHANKPIEGHLMDVLVEKTKNGK
jgi:hypothetical protein